MAQIRNVSGEARYVPSIDRVVVDGETVEIPDELAAGFGDQPAIWDTGIAQPAAQPAAPAPAAAAATPATTPADAPAPKEG